MIDEATIMIIKKEIENLEKSFNTFVTNSRSQIEGLKSSIELLEKSKK